jgi:hypothetical protein
MRRRRYDERTCQCIRTNTAAGIDGRGHVVFYGVARGPEREGIFAGPNPGAAKVVGLGDTLDLATVNFLSFYQNGVNACLEIAFVAGLGDGRTATFMAIPH